MNFITRLHQYALRHYDNGAGRLYIQNSTILTAAGLPSGTRLDVVYSKNRIEITASLSGKNSVIDTGRGPLLELKNQDTGRAFEGFTSVTITVRQGKIIVALDHLTSGMMKGIEALKHRLTHGLPLRVGSLYSGLAMLTYKLSQGLHDNGIKTAMRFANEKSELAMTCQLQGNPIWDTATEDAVAMNCDIRHLDPAMVPKVDIIEIGLPCRGLSKMSPKHRRDLEHPEVGTLFMPTISTLKLMAAPIIVIECAHPLFTSQTWSLMKRELTEYQFSEHKLIGYDHGDFESRERACVVLTAKGLPKCDLDTMTIPASPERRKLGDIMRTVPTDSPLWKTMGHIKKKVDDPRLNFKHNIYDEDATLIAALGAGYQSPKIGSPMVQHPTDPSKQRLFIGVEHADIRELPSRLFSVMEDVIHGRHPLVSKRGSTSAVHEMLGNGISPKAWRNVGRHVGQYLQSLITTDKCVLRQEVEQFA
ncbi:DNA cytosine methyltransferase [Vibrio splendidus]